VKCSIEKSDRERKQWDELLADADVETLGAKIRKREIFLKVKSDSVRKVCRTTNEKARVFRHLTSAVGEKPGLEAQEALRVRRGVSPTLVRAGGTFVRKTREGDHARRGRGFASGPLSVQKKKYEKVSFRVMLREKRRNEKRRGSPRKK